MKVLIDAARQRGLLEMTGEVITENAAMLQLVGDLGFTVSISPDDPGIRSALIHALTDRGHAVDSAPNAMTGPDSR